jgi:GNAT superfamily N-acetyltransferase
MAPSEQLAIATGLAAAEFADAEALVREAGWNQTAADWRMFGDFGTIYAIRNDAGHLVATAAALPYGARFGWISMVLVTKNFQRRGLATRLLRRCIDDLTAQHLVPVLDATPAGREVYRQLGFNDTWRFQRLAAANPRALPSAATDVAVNPITEGILPELSAYDATVFGADRGKLLARLHSRLPHAAFFAQRGGRVAGLLLGREGRIATQLGPLVAEDDDIATALLTRALEAIGGPVFIDVPDARTNLTAWLAARGFAPQRPLIRMVQNGTAAFDDGRRTYAVVGPEFG